MTKADKGKKKEEQDLQQVENLQRQVLLLQDLHQLSNENYFRQQVLMIGERIAQALEKQANLLEKDFLDSSEEESEEDPEEEEEESEEA